MLEGVTKLIEKLTLLLAVGALIAAENGAITISSHLEKGLYLVAGWTVSRPAELLQKAWELLGLPQRKPKNPPDTNVRHG